MSFNAFATEQGQGGLPYKLNIGRMTTLWWMRHAGRRAKPEIKIVPESESWNVVHLAEQMRYDETPLRVRLRELLCRLLALNHPTRADGHDLGDSR